MRVFVFGGTTEGREVACRLAEAGHDVTLSVATPLGAEELAVRSAGEHAIEVSVGKIEHADMVRTLAACDACVDATHPYALHITEHVREACAEAGCPLWRLLRGEEVPQDGCVYVDGIESAARFLASKDGNVLLTTGAKELMPFAALGVERVFARVLPLASSLVACEEAGIPHRNIIAMQGPFSTELNEALMRQLDIAWMVTKDGGVAGGFPEKIAAARAVGAGCVVIERPDERGADIETVLREIEELDHV